MKQKTVEEVIRRYKRGDKEFKSIIIYQGDFSQQRLSGIIFEGATLMECNFEKSILERASFSAANLRGSIFRSANLVKVDLKGADLRGATLRATDLRGADLRWANLEGVDLTGSMIASANFDGANLKNASLKNADPGKWWWKANLDEARLDNTVLPNGTIFSQPDVVRPEIPAQPGEPDQAGAPATAPQPDYERADRLYYEALGIIGSIQSQRKEGLALTHPRLKALMKAASQKFTEAADVADENWSRFEMCKRYAANLLLDLKESTLRDWELR